MIWSDVRRTFEAWRTEPLLPLSALFFAVFVVGAGDVLPVARGAVSLGIFYVGVVGAQRVAYARAWEGRRTPVGRFAELSAELFGRNFALATFGLAVSAVLWVPVLMTGGNRLAAVVALLVVDVLFTFATSAVAVGDESPPRAIATSVRLLRRGLPGCLPHALFPPLALYALANDRGWLLLAAEFVALVARGATTSYYLRATLPPDAPRQYGSPREPATVG